jgi:hypothetical protein
VLVGASRNATSIDSISQERFASPFWPSGEKENEARKAATYLVRRCCKQTLLETVKILGLGSYGAVGWCYHGVQSKMEKGGKFKSELDSMAVDICQRKNLTSSFFSKASQRQKLAQNLKQCRQIRGENPLCSGKARIYFLFAPFPYFVSRLWCVTDIRIADIR